MLTECPSCLTVFRVTGAILKMGHGQVRCGKCRTQFDALDSLLDDEENELGKSEAAEAKAIRASANPASLPQKQDSSFEIDEPDVAEEITLEGSRIEISGTYRVAADDSDANSDGTDQVVHEHVVIDRDEPASPQEDEQENFLSEVPEDQVIQYTADDGEPVANAAQHLMDDANASSSDASAVPLSKRLWKRATGNANRSTSQQIEDELYGIAPAVTTPERKGLWTTLSIVLVFVLGAQAIHHYRDPLVRSPKWGETISRLYRAVGLTLRPNWDLHSYEVQQWGVISDNTARDALRVRASVTNTAAFAQPYPFVKLALEDRWGSIVAVREFAPEEYLQSKASADRMMAPRHRANAEIVIVDPGADAVGFQVHACLPQGSSVVCSDDVAGQ